MLTKDSSYREILTYYYGPHIGRRVGKGLDRAGGHYNGCFQGEAVHYHQSNKEEFGPMDGEVVANIISEWARTMCHQAYPYHLRRG